MIDAFKAFFTLFQQGKDLSHKDVWRNRAQLANALTVFLGALVVIAKGFGYDLHVDQDTLNAAAGGVAAFVAIGNAFVHNIPVPPVGKSSDS